MSSELDKENVVSVYIPVSYKETPFISSEEYKDLYKESIENPESFWGKKAEELINLVKENVGSFAKPDEIKFVGDLPKTKSGKIMRRILRKIAQGQTDNFGDITTLADPKAVSEIISKNSN